MKGVKDPEQDHREISRIMKYEDAGEKIANMAQSMSKDEFMSHADELGLTPEEAAEHYEKMQGEPFNVGLSSANLTKRQLAEQIKTHVPNLFIHSADIGSDPDQRDYMVSNQKLEKLGWQAQHDLDFGIRELLKAYSMLQPNRYVNF